MTGWVKLHRSFLNWEWYDDINTKILFIHILLKANFIDKNWRGVFIERGSFITSLTHLSNETGLTKKQIRTSLSKLIKTGEIGTEKGTAWTKITVCKYEDYQDIETNEGTQKGTAGAQQGHGRGTAGATTKEGKEVKEIKEGKKAKKSPSFTPPTLDEVKKYFKENGYTEQSAEKAFYYYEEGEWKDSHGNQVKNWKQKMRGVWFKDENKINSIRTQTSKLPLI